MIRRLLAAWRRTRTSHQPTVRVRLPNRRIPSAPAPEPPPHRLTPHESALQNWLRARTSPGGRTR